MARQELEEAYDWLWRARSSFLKAKVCVDVEGVAREDLCLDLYEATEWALKALLLYLQRRPPPLHDLENLLIQIAQGGVHVPEFVKEVRELSRYFLLSRHPKLQSPISRLQLLRALDLADETIRWVEEEMVDRARGG